MPPAHKKARRDSPAPPATSDVAATCPIQHVAYMHAPDVTSDRRLRDLVKSNNPPSAEQFAIIEGLNAENIAHQASLVSRLETVKAEEARLAKQIAAHAKSSIAISSLRHPFRAFPLELVTEIFHFCVALEMDSPTYDSLDRRLAPWVLAQVCQSWRNLSLSLPRLWNRVILTLDRIERIGQFKIVYDLRRGLQATQPTALHVVLQNIRKLYPYTAILPTILLTSNRWGRVELESDAMEYIHQCPYLTFPLLKTLSINVFAALWPANQRGHYADFEKAPLECVAVRDDRDDLVRSYLVLHKDVGEFNIAATAANASRWLEGQRSVKQLTVECGPHAHISQTPIPDLSSRIVLDTVAPIGVITVMITEKAAPGTPGDFFAHTCVERATLLSLDFSYYKPTATVLFPAELQSCVRELEHLEMYFRPKSFERPVDKANLLDFARSLPEGLQTATFTVFGYWSPQVKRDLKEVIDEAAVGFAYNIQSENTEGNYDNTPIDGEDEEEED